MTTYHVNDRGEPGVCRAATRCPYGDLVQDHYRNANDARRAYELKNALENIPRARRPKNAAVDDLPALLASITAPNVATFELDERTEKEVQKLMNKEFAEATVAGNLDEWVEGKRSAAETAFKTYIAPSNKINPETMEREADVNLYLYAAAYRRETHANVANSLDKRLNGYMYVTPKEYVENRRHSLAVIEAVHRARWSPQAHRLREILEISEEDMEQTFSAVERAYAYLPNRSDEVVAMKISRAAFGNFGRVSIPTATIRQILTFIQAFKG